MQAVSTLAVHLPVIWFPAECRDPFLVPRHGPSHLQPSVWIPNNDVAIFTAWSHVLAVWWPSKAEYPVFVSCKYNHSISSVPLSLERYVHSCDATVHATWPNQSIAAEPASRDWGEPWKACQDSWCPSQNSNWAPPEYKPRTPQLVK
jgi:hypothetical protein